MYAAPRPKLATTATEPIRNPVVWFTALSLLWLTLVLSLAGPSLCPFERRPASRMLLRL